MRDPYLYPHTEILINKHNIKDEKDLAEMEAEYTSLRLKQIVENPLPGEYDFEHFCELHRWIFQDIYEWAGQPRIINIEKSEPALGGLSIEYAEFFEVKRMANTALNRMKSIAWGKLTLDEKAEKFSGCMAELWKVHSFREGNTRTVVTFCCQFAESRGFVLDRTLFEKHSAYVRTSFVAASAYFTDLGDKSKPEYLIRIVKDSLYRKMAEENH
ncbi:MAG: Fic family protein [Peptococcaceae bacterium]|jgi:cell filamentation protein|nr:Fic family protein [Peptococcaceae bacterium]